MSDESIATLPAEAATEATHHTPHDASHDAPKGMSRRAWLRLGALALVLVGLYALGSATGLTAQLTPQTLSAQMREAGWWGVAIFVVAFSLGNLMQVPGMVFLAASIFVYGRLEGALVGFMGAQVALAVNFWVVRLVGGTPLVEIKQPLMRRLLAQVDARPVRATVALRSIFWMAPPLNMALALSTMRFRDYALGSALGLLVPVTLGALAFDRLIRMLGPSS